MQTEYSNKCDKCKKITEARIFYMPVLDGDYPYLCKECWNRITKLLEEDKWKSDTTEIT